MTLRIEATRRRGPHDPRWPSRRRRAVAAQIEPARLEESHRVGLSVSEQRVEDWEAEGGAVR